MNKYILAVKQFLRKLFPEKHLIYYISIPSFLLLFLIDPIQQNREYHNFTDQRSFLGIPNFLDVTTNISFAILGISGLIVVIKTKQEFAHWSWMVFFAATITLSFTSGYYHWNPTDDTLFWDRLSLGVMFMSLVVALLSEYIDSQIDHRLVIPFVLIGIFSVIYWHIFNDLRFYIWSQLLPMIVIPLLLILYTSKYSHTNYLWITFFAYIMAKISEIFDKEIFLLNSGIISGHSFKHIFAAIGLYFILRMLKNRQILMRN